MRVFYGEEPEQSIKKPGSALEGISLLTMKKYIDLIQLSQELHKQYRNEIYSKDDPTFPQSDIQTI